MSINVDELVEFSQSFPWQPRHPTSLVRRFLNELISSEEYIFGLKDQRGFICAAVLLDKVQNPANDACLEILGIHPAAKIEELFPQVVLWAKSKVPKGRAGFQMGVHESLVSRDFLSELGFVHHYDTYEMKHTEIKSLANIQCSSEILKANSDDVHEVYEVLCKSFSQNPETSIPDKNTWAPGFMRSPKSHYYLWRSEGKILGFAHLVEDENGEETEIRTIGVLPKHRGHGLGRHLLNYCLQQSKVLGYSTSHLTVAVKNESALGLYLRAGFKPIDKYQCFRTTSF